MYQRILLAVDGSDISNLALEEAIGLAKEHRAALRIVNVADLVTLSWEGDYGDMNEIQEHFRRSGRETLEKAQNTAREAGVEAETKLLEVETRGHRIADVIVAEAERWPADLIVVGTHGRRGLRHLLLGSVAEGVAHSSTMPVLLVRKNK